MWGPIIKATSQLKTSIKHHYTVHLCSQRLYLQILQQFFECKPEETMWKFFLITNQFWTWNNQTWQRCFIHKHFLGERIKNWALIFLIRLCWIENGYLHTFDSMTCLHGFVIEKSACEGTCSFKNYKCDWCVVSFLQFSHKRAS